MFIFIFEDGSKKLYAECADDDLRASSDGYLEIIDVSVADKPTQYYNGVWENIAVDAK